MTAATLLGNRRVDVFAGRCLLVLIIVLSILVSHTARAQRSGEDAVTEAEDAFGMTVGRQSVGLYSGGGARGFSPEQAGNLRIDGLYFDQVPGYFTGLPTRVVRNAGVHVGIAAQGYLFPAPTGVVDFQLRSPGKEAGVSTLNGYATNDVYYNETDFSTPVIRDRLSFGGGVGYSHNATYQYAERSDELTAGALARWEPTPSLVITPFWGMTTHLEYGEKPYYFSLSDAGLPRFRSVDTQGQPWANWRSVSHNFGATARMSLGGGWLFAGGIFRSLSDLPLDYVATLSNLGASNEGDYGLLAFPPNNSGSTSGEMRLTKLFGSAALRNTVYFRLTGRNSSIESGGADFVSVGPGTTTYSPYAVPVFTVGETTDVHTRQWTPGIAYRGVWHDKVQLTLGVQKVFYRRVVTQPSPLPTISYSTAPWLFSAAASGSVTSKLLFYGSYTRGFENLGIAPVTASNANEPVPSVLTWQVDAGLRYQLLPRVQLVAGVFEIDKPYFDLDQSNLFRLVGTTRNRGAEFSLTGALTDRLNVVSGVVLIQPRVQYTGGAVGGAQDVVAIGPDPGYMSTYLQYRPELIPGLILGTSLQLVSSRYAVYPTISLPAVATVGADVRYQTKLLGQDASFWLRAHNLTDAHALTPSPSRQVLPIDGRRFDFSLVVDF